MLAQSHRHAEVVKLLQKEMKRKSHWMPPLSELWALLFGGAGESKGPLLFFLVSVLLWGYPMYVIRVRTSYYTSESNEITCNINGGIFLVHTAYMEHTSSIALLLPVLECHNVDKLVDRKP